MTSANNYLGSANDQLTEICMPGSRSYAYSARTLRREKEAKLKIAFKGKSQKPALANKGFQWNRYRNHKSLMDEDGWEWLIWPYSIAMLAATVFIIHGAANAATPAQQRLLLSLQYPTASMTIAPSRSGHFQNQKLAVRKAIPMAVLLPTGCNLFSDKISGTDIDGHREVRGVSVVHEAKSSSVGEVPRGQLQSLKELQSPP